MGLWQRSQRTTQCDECEVVMKHPQILDSSGARRVTLEACEAQVEIPDILKIRERAYAIHNTRVSQKPIDQS